MGFPSVLKRRVPCYGQRFESLNDVGRRKFNRQVQLPAIHGRRQPGAWIAGHVHLNLGVGLCKSAQDFGQQLVGGDTIAITAGSLDSTADLKTAGHVWVSQTGDYCAITDHLPRFEKSPGGRLA